MKVLHLPVNPASQASLTVRALRDAGVDVLGLVRNPTPYQDCRALEVYPVADLAKHPVHGGRHFKDHFVGFQIYKVFIPPDAVTGFLVPGEHGSVGNGFGKGWDIDICTHSSEVLRFIDGLMRPVSASSIRVSCCFTCTG